MESADSKTKDLVNQLNAKVIRDAAVDAATEHFAVQLVLHGMVGHYLRCYAPEMIEYCDAPGQQGYFCITGRDIACPPPQHNQPSDELVQLVQDFQNNLEYKGTGLDDFAEGNFEFSNSPHLIDAANFYAESIVQISNRFSPNGLLIPGRLAKLDVLDSKTSTILSQIDRWASRKLKDTPQMQRQQSMVDTMKNAVKNVALDAAFTCGGSITLDRIAAPIDDDHSLYEKALQIRFDLDNGKTDRAVFGGFETDNTGQGVTSILQQCAPASFGRGGQDVFDTSYRNAMKLDPARFSTNFHPHDYGILDHIARVLLPLRLYDKANQAVHKPVPTVHAILYKLNVYSGPSGRFKPHVDTPRSSKQFGSLVVSLPSYHVGGALRVMHGDENKTVTYNWGSSLNIEWAAFFSDCEHEVEEVTSGHRITLTYNLYWNECPPMSETRISPADLGCTDLRTLLYGVLQSQEFMPKGGVLGFYCQHAYARNLQPPSLNFSRFKKNGPLLKGADMIMYYVFKALGLNPSVKSIITQEELEDAKPEYGSDRDSNHYSDSESKPEVKVKQDTIITPACIQTLEGIQVQYSTLDPATPVDTKKTFQERFQYLLNQRRIPNLDTVAQEREDHVSSFVSPLEAVDKICEYEHHRNNLLRDHQDWDQIHGIHWLNEACERQPAISYLAYGNEASPALMYSSGAITVVVPPWSPTRGQSINDDGSHEGPVKGHDRSIIKDEPSPSQHEPFQDHEPNIDASSFPQDVSFSDYSQGSELKPIEID